MADNTQLNTGSGGDTIATDDIGGTKYPRSKIVIGADGTNDGDVSATNPLPVKGTGTAGTANAGVLTIQGIASMVAIKTDGSGVTQPVSGTVTANIGTVGTLALDATLITIDGHITGGTAQTVIRSGTVGASPGAKISSTPIDANHEALDVVICGAGGHNLVPVSPGESYDGNLHGIAQFGSDGSAYRLISTNGSGHVNIADGSNSITVDNSGTFAVQAAQSGTWTVTGAGGSFPITDSGGSLTVDAPVGTPVFVRLSDGASAITTLAVSLASVPSHAVTNAGTFAVQPTPATSGGLTMHTAISAATNNATSVKGSAGQIFAIEVMNKNASPRYLKLYNKATAPNPASDTPVKTLLIPGNTAGSGMVLNWTMGLAFSTGIAYAVVAGIGTTDNTAISAEDVAINMDYA